MPARKTTPKAASSPGTSPSRSTAPRTPACRRSRGCAGAPFIFRSVKKADIEYILQLNLRRDKKSETEWRDLHHSLYTGQLALYDDKGRLVAGRATENGGE